MISSVVCTPMSAPIKASSSSSSVVSSICFLPLTATSILDAMFSRVAETALRNREKKLSSSTIGASTHSTTFSSTAGLAAVDWEPCNVGLGVSKSFAASAAHCSTVISTDLTVSGSTATGSTTSGSAITGAVSAFHCAICSTCADSSTRACSNVSSGALNPSDIKSSFLRLQKSPITKSQSQISNWRGTVQSATASASCARTTAALSSFG